MKEIGVFRNTAILPGPARLRSIQVSNSSFTVRKIVCCQVEQTKKLLSSIGKNICSNITMMMMMMICGRIQLDFSRA
jgi:hypothetical protein